VEAFDWKVLPGERKNQAEVEGKSLPTCT